MTRWPTSLDSLVSSRPVKDLDPRSKMDNNPKMTLGLHTNHKCICTHENTTTKYINKKKEKNSLLCSILLYDKMFLKYIF